MITWHPTGAGGATASVAVHGIALVVLHAAPDRWQLQDMVGYRGGPATSLPGAKRQALEALAAVLREAGHEVDVALRSG